MDKKRAIEDLYLKYRERVYRTSFYILKDPYLAEEIVHDTFIKASCKLDSLQDLSKAESWLCRIAANETYNLLRKSKEIKAVTYFDTDAVNVDGDPCVSYLNYEIKSEIKIALDTLKPEEWLLVTLYFYENLTIKEIATTLDIPVGTVKSRLFYLKRKIGDRLMRKEIGGVESGHAF